VEGKRAGGRGQQAAIRDKSQIAIANRNCRQGEGGEAVASGDFRPGAFYWGWMPPHPTFFVRRSVYEKYGTFRLDLGTAADYELMLRLLLKHCISTNYIAEVLVRMRVGGKAMSAWRLDSGPIGWIGTRGR